jgi:hypothetical protein
MHTALFFSARTPVRTALFFLLFFLPAALMATDIAGKLKGVVKDPSGAAIAGAVVTLQGMGTNIELQATSGPGGTYSFESVLPRVYTVRCEHPGFRTFLASDLRVISQQTLTLDIRLTIGQVNEKVEVVAAAAQVDTSGATIQNTMENNSLMALPVDGRDFRLTAELLQPGTVQGPQSNVGPTTRVNGTRGNTGNNYKIDGTESIDYYNGAATAFPEVENVEEFTVLSNAYGAKYGTGVGSQVTAIIKSGTNNLHGMFWTYLQNQAWNANTWRNDQLAIARPPGSQQWYGGNFGGPVYIPHLYNGKNKTFFFVSYEHTSSTQRPLQQQRVPTNAERVGDFSNDPQTTWPVINGTSTPTLDPTQFSPMAKSLLANPALLPTTSDPNGLFSWLGTSTDTAQPFIAKIDHQFTQNHRIFGSVFWSRDNKIWDPLFGIQFGTPTLPNEGASTFATRLQAWSLNYNWTISPNMLNTVVFGYRPLDINVLRSKVNPTLTWTAAGLPNIQIDTGASATQVGICVNVCNTGDGTTGFFIWGNYDNPLHELDVYVADDFSWTGGRHTLQAGFDIRTHHNNNFQNYQGAGQFTFSDGQPGSTGNATADFLLGQGANFSQISLLQNSLRYPSRDFYFQDVFKVNRRLTATLGLRWSPFFGTTEVNNELGAFRPGQQSTLFPNAPLGLVVPGDPGIPAATFPTRWKNFAPRIGLAFDPKGDGKMAIRAGYGIYYDYQNLLGFDQFASSVPYGLIYNPPTAVPVTNPYLGAQLFPYAKPVPGAGSKTFVFPNTPLTIFSFSPSYNAGRVHQWNVNYQWEAIKDLLVSVAYVGTRGEHLNSSIDLNTPFFVPGGSTEDPANVQSRRPYPQLASILYNVPSTSSRYNSFQTTVNKRLSRGLAVMGSYTLSKATDNGDTIGTPFLGLAYRDPRNPNLDAGPSRYDIRHVFTTTYNYELPFPSGASHWTKTFLGGWAISGTVRAQSGDPLTIISPVGNNDASTAGAWANYMGGPLSADHSSRAAQAAQWFNVNAFCPVYGLGPAPDCNSSVDPQYGVTSLNIGNSKRGMLRGPGRFLNDFSITKRFPFSERWANLEFRLSAFNVFNHTVLDDPDTNIGDYGGTFGQITSAEPNRRVQLSLHYTF